MAARRNFALDGVVGTDLIIEETSGTEIDWREEGVQLTHPACPPRFIRTARKPTPGAKIMALEPIDDLRTGPWLTKDVLGGGVYNCADTLADLNIASDGAVHLLNAGKEPPGCRAACRDAGISLHCFGRMPAPVNAVFMTDADRTIVKSPLKTPDNNGHAPPPDARMVRRAVSRAHAVLSVSPKDPALTSAMMSMCNGARRFTQLTGSLPFHMTLMLARHAHGIVSNLSEWGAFARAVGLPVPDVSENDRDSFEVAARLLTDLNRLGLAGRESVCTLGRHGLVAADSRSHMAFKVRLEMLDGTAGVPTPAGTGDMLYAAFAFYRTSRPARHGGRVLRAATRGMHYVAKRIGLGRKRYRLRIEPATDGPQRHAARAPVAPAPLLCA